MRKRELLTETMGGICAPAGFRANAVCAGIYETCRLEKRAIADEDVALIVAKGRYPTACVFAQGQLQGAPVIFNRKHLKGYARAIFVNSGVANVCATDAIKNTIRVCDEVARRLIISRDEIVMASTGEITAHFPTETILNGLGELVAGLDTSEEKSLAVARAITTTDTQIKQLSYTYMQGDYPCKFGVVCKGNTRVAPNMATTLCFITTDVNISPEMLQRALSSVASETFNLITGDGLSSPNDTLCIMSSCLAGNYKISAPDTEYKKFYTALKAVCIEACKRILRECGRLLTCEVEGARSVRVARAIAKALINAEKIKKDLRAGTLCVTDLVCAIGGVEEPFRMEAMRVSLTGEAGELVLIENGKPFPCVRERVEEIVRANEVTVAIRVGQGNYSAEARGVL